MPLQGGPNALKGRNMLAQGNALSEEVGFVGRSQSQRYASLPQGSGGYLYRHFVRLVGRRPGFLFLFFLFWEGATPPLPAGPRAAGRGEVSAAKNLMIKLRPNVG